MVGAFAACGEGEAGDAAFESRAFIAGEAAPEDPVTGSANALVAAQLLAQGRIKPFQQYLASQGREVGRDGRDDLQHIVRRGRVAEARPAPPLECERQSTDGAL